MKNITIEASKLFSYDDTTVMCKLLPQGESCIRIENLRGGNTPDFVFMGIIPTAALNGSTSLSSLKFENCEIEEVNFLLEDAMDIVKVFPKDKEMAIKQASERRIIDVV